MAVQVERVKRYKEHEVLAIKIISLESLHSVL